VIPNDKEGLTLRGKKGCWPIITSAGAPQRADILVHVTAPQTTIEHLVLAHVVLGKGGASALRASATGFRLRSAVLYVVSMAGDPHSFRNDRAVDSVADNCIFVGHAENQGELAVSNSIWLRHALREVKGPLKLYNVVVPAFPTASKQKAGAPCEVRHCTIPSRALLAEGSNVIRRALRCDRQGAFPGSREARQPLLQQGPDVPRPGQV